MDDELERRVRLMNKAHGYGGIFNHGARDKQIVELSTAHSWCEALRSEFGLVVGEPELNPDDPPDFFVTVEAQVAGVELVQLINEDHKKRALAGETPFADDLFKDMQWTGDRLQEALNAVIEGKGGKYSTRGKVVDALVVHTDETWLSAEAVGRWLPELRLVQPDSIRSAFLLMTYEPGRGTPHWPLFRLYGNGPFAPR
jgi:hypothetical protein